MIDFLLLYRPNYTNKIAIRRTAANTMEEAVKKEADRIGPDSLVGVAHLPEMEQTGYYLAKVKVETTVEVDGWLEGDINAPSDS